MLSFRRNGELGLVWGGIVAKRKFDPYLIGSSTTWYKIRNRDYSQWVDVKSCDCFGLVSLYGKYFACKCVHTAGGSAFRLAGINPGAMPSPAGLAW